MKRAALLTLSAALFIVFCSLGSWQLERRVWKLELIDQVDQQLNSPPTAAPGPADWPEISDKDSYRPVIAKGRFIHQQETLVQAMTVLGSGYWVLTPFVTDGGFTVLVNRGFVDPPHRDPDSRQPDSNSHQPLELTGLLRITEPGGRLFQANLPDEDRWYSRDTAAIGAHRGLAQNSLAPYFIDAKASSGNSASKWPVGGLTVVAFRNSHLVYAITWYALGLLCAVAAIIVVRSR